MIEKLVSFETAKLANEKGFDIFTENIYGSDGYSYCKDFWEDGYHHGISRIAKAPRQSLLQTWLREIHNIDVFVIPNTGMNNEKIYCCHVKNNNKYVRNSIYIIWQSQYKTFEDSLEIGLIKALKLIPKAS